MQEAEMTLASRWKRLGGAMLDGLIAMAVLIPVMFMTGLLQQALSGAAIPLGQQVAFFVLGWAVFLVLNGYLLLKRGQTIGKVIMKTRIVDLDGEIPNFGRIFCLRYLLFGAATHIPILGSLVVLADALFIFRKERRCLHDYVAGTKVVNA